MKKQKGISLIVLIITIVVIIILGTAIIVNIAKTNVIENANEAVVKQDFKTMQEELDMYIADEFASSKGEFDITTIDASTQDEVQEILKSSAKSKYIQYVTIEDGKIVIDGETPEDVKEWANEAINGVGNVTPSTPTTPETPIEPEEKTPVIQAGTEVTTENSSITGGKFLSTNPVIPVGFKAKETADASWSDTNNDEIVDGWNDGLVIADASGNEFVWVPCTTNKNDTTKIQYIKKIEDYPEHPTVTTANISNDTYALPVKNENYQIDTYGGFYVGRYEAGVPANQTVIDGTSKEKSNTTGKPVIKKGATVWTYISYSNAMANAKKLYENSTSVKSGLLTGTQWDTICTWIQSEIGSEGKAVHDVINSVSWGNYVNSINKANVEGYGSKQVTGFSDYWRAKNIYDLAGNTWEWIGENDSVYYICRGGYYLNDGSVCPVSYRNGIDSSVTDINLSFRLVLYVM